MLRANYKREFKKYSEQRSNRGELQTSLIYYLLGIHIPICPQYQNSDSYTRAAMYSTETISSLPGLVRYYSSGQWDVTAVYPGYLEKFCYLEKSVTPSFLIFPTWGLKYPSWNQERVNHTENGGAERQKGPGTLMSPWSHLTSPGIHRTGKKTSLGAGGGQGALSRAARWYQEINTCSIKTTYLKDNRMSPATFKRLVILQSNLIYSLFSFSELTHTKMW